MMCFSVDIRETALFVFLMIQESVLKERLKEKVCENKEVESSKARSE